MAKGDSPLYAVVVVLHDSEAELAVLLDSVEACLA